MDYQTSHQPTLKTKHASLSPRLLTLREVTSVSIALSFTGSPRLWFSNPELSEFQGTGRFQGTYLTSLWECSTQISHISIIFPSTPASPLASLLLFEVLTFIQVPRSNTLSHLHFLFLLPKLQRCSVWCPPLLHIHIHISLVQILLAPLSRPASGVLPGPPPVHHFLSGPTLI